MMQKILGISKESKTYAVCPKCNKLYNITEILPSNNTANTGFECTHVEFPNHPRKAHRKPCKMELTKSVPIINGYINKPKMVFPIISLKTQLITMYQRPGFESLLQKWMLKRVYCQIFMMAIYGKSFHHI